MFLRSSRVVWVLLLSFCFVASVVSSAGAAPGDVDRSFGQEGVATITSDSNAYVTPEDMTIDASNQIYALRFSLKCSVSPCAGEYLVGRSLPNGLPDGSFGVAGVRGVLPASVYPLGRGGSVAAPADGRVVV